MSVEPAPCPADVVAIPIPTPYPVGPVNVYLVRGAVPALIDAGPPTAEARQALAEALERAGTPLSRIGRVVLTHAHLDHHGLLGHVAEVSGAEVCAHPFAARNLRGGDPGVVSFYRAFLAEAGAPPEEAGPTLQVAEAMARLDPRVERVTWVDQGDVLQLGSGHWQVLPCPGHASSQICLYRVGDRTLLAADHLLPEVSSNAFVEPPLPGERRRPRTLLQYMQALARSAELEVDVVLPGHGSPFRGHRSLIRRRLAAMEQRLAEIRSLVGGEPRTAYEVARTLFAPFDPARLFLALSEVVGHLDVLEARGQVRATRRGDVLVYRATGAGGAAGGQGRSGEPVASARTAGPGKEPPRSGEKEEDEKEEGTPVTVQEIMEAMQSRLAQNPGRMQGQSYVVQFDLAGDEGGQFYLAVEDGKAETGAGSRPDAGVTLSMAVPDFVRLARGELSGTAAFMSGKLKIQGDLGLAMKLQQFLG